MTRFEEWVRDTDISFELQTAFICKHYDGKCKHCPIKGICTDDKKAYEYLMAESEHKRLLDADELLKRIAEKCKTPSLSEDTVNGLCGATAIIYDMLNESGKEK